MKFSQIALLSAATLAVAQPHQHAHRHAGKRGSPVEARDAVATTVVSGPVVTIFQLNGVSISAEEVEKGIKEGKYVLVGGQISSVASAAPVATSAPVAPSAPVSSAAPASSSVQAAQFLEKKPSSVPSSTYAAPVSSTKPASSSSASASSGSSSGSGSSSSGSWPDYDGSLDCSEFPSDFGAVALDWLNLGGFSGIQKVPNFSGKLVGDLISYIETGSAGTGCVKNSFCSYACPAGYQKSQWPESQGSTGQSIGGLYCNSKGKLELSRPDVKQLCIAGTGGVTVKSSLSSVVSICRTDYPGTESETVPLAVKGGSKDNKLTCPDANTYYTWQNSKTSAQYYLNPSGYEPKDACWWNTAGSNLGNYSPANLGVGRGTDGVTYVSLFPNHPSNMDGKLDYNVAITGGSGSCEYKNGQYYDNGVSNPKGCTVGATGPIVVEFS